MPRLPRPKTYKSLRWNVCLSRGLRSFRERLTKGKRNLRGHFSRNEARESVLANKSSDRKKRERGTRRHSYDLVS